MIARKVKPGVLEIIDVQSQDELESYTLLELSDKDAYLLATSAKQFTKDGHVVTINYESGDETDSMFKALAHHHQETNSKNFIDEMKKYVIDKDVMIPGTSLLIRDIKNGTIKVAYRKNSPSKEGTINRLFVTNKVRDQFFDDVRVCKKHKQDPNTWILDKQDKKAYDYWCNYMNEQYVNILNYIKESKDSKKCE